MRCSFIQLPKGSLPTRSDLCCYKAKILRKTDQDNALFLYLVWISTGFMIFGVSRSVSHILRQFLILISHTDTWQMIAAFSGSVNTVSFMLVSLITLFFNQSWKINEKILTSRRKLKAAHGQLLSLNQNLEQKVMERTDMGQRTYKEAKEITLTQFNHNYISAMLSMTKGNITQAARRCAMDRQALQQIMKRYAIDPEKFRNKPS